MKKKTRFHSRWKDDSDYLDRLSDEDREWMEQFCDEYYRAEFSEDSLHDEAGRKKIYDDQNRAARDIATATGDAVSKSIEKIAAVERPSLVPRFYSPDDWRMFSEEAGITEDELIEYLERLRADADLPGFPEEFHRDRRRKIPA